MPNGNKQKKRKRFCAAFCPNNHTLFVALTLLAAIFCATQFASQHHLSHEHHPTPKRRDKEQHALQHQPALFLSKQKTTPKKNASASSSTASRVVRNDDNATTTAQQQQPPGYHIVFSTSCAPQQHWEAMVFFYHAYKVQQPGTVTRIVSGCQPGSETDEQQRFFQAYIQPLNPNNFFIHFTPNYASIQKSDYGGSYKYMNKPYGVRHWMEHGLLNMTNAASAAKYDNDIVILMDPDMILLRPMTHEFGADSQNHLWVDDDNKPPLTRRVRHGFPMAQQDGYLSSHPWMALNMTYIVGTPQHPPIPPSAEGRIHWNTGPPYLVTVRDMYQIVLKWTEYTPRVLQLHPKLFAEMYGFIFATVQLKMPFTLLKSLVVSTTTTRDREGWEYVDALTDNQVCDPPTTGEVKLPIALHYCKRYLHGPMMFSKYRLKKNIMDCNKRLLQPPPQPFYGQYNYTVQPPRAFGKETYVAKHEPIRSPKIAKREAFMLCGLTRAINEALEHHKRVACPNGTANLEKTYTIYNDPTNT